MRHSFARPTQVFYQPRRSLFIGGDDSRAWSSAASGYVVTNPLDKVTRIASEAELCDALDPFGLKGHGWVPRSVRMWQAKAALQAAGKLDAANAAVSGSGNQQIIMAWNDAPEISRDNPTVAAIGQAIGLASADIDQLFIAADAIAV
jgi:hypothetical protein